MTKYLALLLGLLLALAAGDLRAQQLGNQGATNQGAVTPQGPGNTTSSGRGAVQSLSPSKSACSAGSQSVRVCNDDFRSCGSTCTATALDASADIAGCSLRCCTNFKACLSIRGCASPRLQCF
jgi:hypothetical protein